MNINPSEHSTDMLINRRRWMKRSVDDLLAEIDAIDAELGGRLTVRMFDASNDEFQNFDVWGVTDGHGDLVFVSTYEASAREWAARS